MIDHEHVPEPLPEIPLVSCSSLPEAGRSTYTTCKICGAPIRVMRSSQVQWTIWGWREAHGCDPYKPCPEWDPPCAS